MSRVPEIVWVAGKDAPQKIATDGEYLSSRKKRAVFHKRWQAWLRRQVHADGMIKPSFEKQQRSTEGCFEQELKISPENKEIEDRLAAHPFLKGLGMDHVAVLAQSAVPTRFEKDELIFKAGEPANGFYLIETGAVALEGSIHDQGPITTDVVSAGEPLGWSWLFPPYLWHFDARATEPTTAICLSGILLRQHRDEDPALSHELFRRTCEVMVRRLQGVRRKLLVGKNSAMA